MDIKKQEYDAARASVDRAVELSHEQRDINFFAFVLLNIPMENMKHPSARAGFLLTVARMALQQLAVQSGRKFAAYIAVEALLSKRGMRAACFVVPFLLVGGVLQYLEILLRLVARISN